MTDSNLVDEGKRNAMKRFDIIVLQDPYKLVKTMKEAHAATSGKLLKALNGVFDIDDANEDIAEGLKEFGGVVGQVDNWEKSYMTMGRGLSFTVFARLSAAPVSPVIQIRLRLSMVSDKHSRMQVRMRASQKWSNNLVVCLTMLKGWRKRCRTPRH